VEKMPKAGAYPVTLFQRLQMWPLCRWAPDLGVPLDTGAGDTSQMRQLRRRASPSQPGLSGEDRGNERGKTGISRLPYIPSYPAALPEH
jgi:hypothetical protein